MRFSTFSSSWLSFHAELVRLFFSLFSDPSWRISAGPFSALVPSGFCGGLEVTEKTIVLGNFSFSATIFFPVTVLSR